MHADDLADCTIAAAAHSIFQAARGHVCCCRLALAGLVLTRRLTKCWSFFARAAPKSQHHQSSKTLAQSGGALHLLQMPVGLAAMPTPVLPKRKSLRQQPAATIHCALPTPTVPAAKAVVLPQSASQPGKRRRVEAEATVTVTGSVHGLKDTVSLQPHVLPLLASICWDWMSGCIFTSASSCRDVACYSMLPAACACNWCTCRKLHRRSALHLTVWRPAPIQLWVIVQPVSVRL